MASDLGPGKSTRIRWWQMIADHELLSSPHDGMRLERARLRQERDLLKKRRHPAFERHGAEVRSAKGRHVTCTPVLLRKCQHQL